MQICCYIIASDPNICIYNNYEKVSGFSIRCMNEDIQTSSIRVNSPNGGETWQAGSTQNIQWSSTYVTNIKIEYSADNGINYSTIIASTPASAGQYSWVVPNNPSTNCKIRISNSSNLTVYDVSDAVFTISPLTAVISVIVPNGGENWQAGTSQSIQWSYVNVSNVKIEYNTNN